MNEIKEITKTLETRTARKAFGPSATDYQALKFLLKDIKDTLTE